MQQPENIYAGISEQNVEQMILKWLAIGPESTYHYFMKSLNIETKPTPTLKNTSSASFFKQCIEFSYEQPIHIKSAAPVYV